MTETSRVERIASDLVAGVTFAVVSVPQAMAHALLAAVSPVLGIYTLMVAVPVGAVFTSSVFMNVSTTGALSVAGGEVLSELPAPDRPEALAAMVLLAGAFQLLAGVFRLGFFIRFVSNSVMTGFLNGVAVVIILGQLGDLTGYRSAQSNRVAQALDLILNVYKIDLPTTLIGAAAIAAILVVLASPLRRYAFILAIVAATLLLMLVKAVPSPFGAAFASVPTVGAVVSIPRSLPTLVIPGVSSLLAMLLPAASLALIGLIQGAGVSQGTPNPDGQYPDISRDFLGQGVANMATGLVGGITAGGSISGTVLTMGAGAQTRWANIFGGAFVALIVLAAAPLVERVPMPALAALLIVAGVQGTRVEQAMMSWRTGRASAVVMVVTFGATILMPLQYAVLVGVALNVAMHVLRQSSDVAITQWVLQPGGFPIEEAAPAVLPGGELTFLQIYGSLFFAAAKTIEDKLPAPPGGARAVVAISLRGAEEVGSTFVTVLQSYAKVLQNGGSKLMLVGVQPSVRAQLERTGVLKVIGEENVFVATPQLGDALNRAVAAANTWLGHPQGVKA